MTRKVFLALLMALLLFLGGMFGVSREISNVFGQVTIITGAGANATIFALPGGVKLMFSGAPTASIAAAGSLAILYNLPAGFTCPHITLWYSVTPTAAVTAPPFVSAVTTTGFTINNQGTAASTYSWAAACV